VHTRLLDIGREVFRLEEAFERTGHNWLAGHVGLLMIRDKKKRRGVGWFVVVLGLVLLVLVDPGLAFVNERFSGCVVAYDCA